MKNTHFHLSSFFYFYECTSHDDGTNQGNKKKPFKKGFLDRDMLRIRFF